MPESVSRRWYADRKLWLQRHHIDLSKPGWKEELLRLPNEVRNNFVQTFSERWHTQLDHCHGACVLSDPAMSLIVVESLMKFDGDRYELTDFVVMPNHVHLIAAFATEDSMLAQCTSWKHYTAHQINSKLGQSGPFWQQDGFDHLIRSEDQFQKFRKYISCNGPKANLPPNKFRHYSKELGRDESKTK
ncbi:transposase [Schlesneria sp. DSM 10557]|uniref:transposase n=1 Tax=Schlesneria sp. DSM 10557 TaxID=3044399 RepID=UPI00359F5069